MKCDVHLLKQDEQEIRATPCSQEAAGLPVTLSLSSVGKYSKKSKRKTPPKVPLRARLCRDHHSLSQAGKLVFYKGKAAMYLE